MRARSASTLLRAVMARSACRVWASVIDGTPIVSSFERIFHGRGTPVSIAQNFHVLKGTKISFYTVFGSSRSIRRMHPDAGVAGRGRLSRGSSSMKKLAAFVRITTTMSLTALLAAVFAQQAPVSQPELSEIEVLAKRVNARNRVDA